MRFPKRIPFRNSDLTWRAIEGQVIVLRFNNPDNTEEIVDVFNESASRAWELIDGQRTISKIISILVEEFDVDEKEAALDVKALFDILEKKRLISFRKPHGLKMESKRSAE